MKVKVFKVDTNTKSREIPADETAFTAEHNCVDVPVDFGILADLLHENTWHESCLRAKARVIAQLGFDIRNDKLSEDIIKKIKKPNSDYFFTDMLGRVMLDYEIYGNAYIEVVRIGNNVEKLYHLPARDVRIDKDRKGYWQIPKGKLLTGQYFCNFDEKSKNPADHELIHLKNYTPLSSYYGLPEYLGCVPAITTLTYIAEFNLRYFSNGCMPDLAIIVEGGELDSKTEDEIVDYLAENMKGLVNSHKTLFLNVNQKDVKIRIEKLNEVKEGSFKILRDSSRDEIISAHGVPPRLAGIMVAGSLGGTNESKAQMQTFMDVYVKPKQKALTESLNEYYEMMYGQSPDFYLYELEIRTYDEKVVSGVNAVNSGVLTTDEVREELGYAKMENTNDLVSTLKSIRKSFTDSL